MNVSKAAMLLLGIYLILVALSGFGVAMPIIVLAVLALIAGILVIIANL